MILLGFILGIVILFFSFAFAVMNIAIGNEKNMFKHHAIAVIFMVLGALITIISLIVGLWNWLLSKGIL